MRTLKEVLADGTVLIADGSIGTQLQKAGLQPGGCGDEWNVTNPEKVFRMHRDYVKAGAQVLTTNTFGANQFVLSTYGLEDRQAEIARRGAELARAAIGDTGWVMGSVGPCGGFLEPLGSVSRGALEASLRVQIGALLEGGVDAIILETLTAAEELEVAVRVARSMDPPLLIASCTFDRLPKGGFRTMMGATPQAMASIAVNGGADVIGSNCGTSMRPEDFAAIVAAYREVTKLPLLLEPNGGSPRLDGGAIVYPLTPGELANSLLPLAGTVQILGGCCGSSPEHIRVLAEGLKGIAAVGRS